MAAKKKSKKSSGSKSGPRQASDRDIYFVVLIVGAFGLMLWWVASRDTVMYAGLGYLLTVAFYVNHSAMLAWKGQSMPHWRTAMARLPLRFAGYGRKGGKPLEAAHDQPDAGRTIVISTIVSLVVLIGLAAFLIV